MEIEAHILMLDELPNERAKLERLVESLPFGEGERERLLNIRNEAALRQSLGGWLALQRLAKKRGLPSSLAVVRGERGKPYFADPCLPEFSISHSGSMCVAVLCERAGVSVGVDLQLAEVRGNPRAIAERFFSAEEQRLCADDPEQPSVFFKLWTQKEAAAKQIGDGLAAILRAPEAHIPMDTRTLRIRSGGQIFYLSLAAAEKITALPVSSKRRRRTPDASEFIDL